MDQFTIECFLHLVETGSFTKASLKAKRTQSALTQQIGKLEKELKKKLFYRGKKIILTPDGEIFYSYAQKIFRNYRELIDRFSEPELEGEISIGLPEDFATLFLSEILIDFSKIHPRVSLQVECDLTMNLYEKFKKGSLDMVLVKMIRPEDFPYGVEVWSEPMEWVGARSFSAKPEEEALPMVLSPEPCVYRKMALRALDKKNIAWKVSFTSPSYVGMMAAVKAGMGVTLLPATMIPKELAPIRDKNFPSLPEIHVSLLHQKNRSATMATLQDFLLQRIRKREAL